MAIEPAILDRDERGRSERIELRHVDRRLLDRAAPGDGMTVIADQQQRRVLKWLERARQRRGEDQPDQSQQQDPGDGIEVDRPAAAPCRLLLLLGLGLHR
jgi:hypothetical protein